jgi:hypothetical protein
MVFQSSNVNRIDVSMFRDSADASVTNVHSQLITPQLKFLPSCGNAECMAGGDRRITFYTIGDLGIHPTTMLGSGCPTSGPSSAFGISAE